MKTAKIFACGKIQAVLLPTEYRFSVEEVYIRKVGNTVMLFPKEKVWEIFLEGLNSFTEDFFVDGYNQSVQAPRETL